MEEDAVVIDVGSRRTRVGFAGENRPRGVFMSVLGRPRFFRGALPPPEPFRGDNAFSKRGICQLSWPVERGRIEEWGDYEMLLNHSFYDELRTDPGAQSVLLTENSFPGRESRQTLTELMFERFRVPELLLANQSALSLYAAGRISGIVLQSGFGQTQALPFHEGIALEHAMEHENVGGQDCTQYLLKLMSDWNFSRGFSFTGSSEVNYMVENIKEKVAFVSEDCSKESYQLSWLGQKQLWLGRRDPGSPWLNFPADLVREVIRRCQWPEKFVDYELPDGQMIQLGKERYHCPEAMFNFSLFSSVPQSTARGVQQLVAESIRKCDAELHKLLFQNVLLSGGNTMFPHFARRLQTELGAFSDDAAHVLPNSGIDSAWIGGSILASLPLFRSMSVSRKEYDEFGSAIMSRKCLHLLIE